MKNINKKRHWYNPQNGGEQLSPCSSFCGFVGGGEGVKNGSYLVIFGLEKY